MPRATRASKKAAEAIRCKSREKVEAKEIFKMKRFKDIAPRTNTNNRSKSLVKNK
jgi:hypothetical protein